MAEVLGYREFLITHGFFETRGVFRARVQRATVQLEAFSAGDEATAISLAKRYIDSGKAAADFISKSTEQRAYKAARRAGAVELHKAFLGVQEANYPGTGQPLPYAPSIPHCRLCQSKLDLGGPTCKACGRFICVSCGACFCSPSGP